MNLNKQHKDNSLTKHNDFSNRTVNFVLFTILLTTSFIYFQSLSYDFFYTWDDYGYVTNNEAIKELSWENIKLLFTSFYLGNYQPITMLLYALEYKLGLGEVTIFHFVNILLHLINTILVFVFIKKISPQNTVVALFVAAFFAVHPMHIESVVWIAETKDVLYTFFFLLSLIMYLNYRSIQKSIYLIYSLLFLILSCSSKSAAVILPLVLVAIDYYQNRDINFKTLVEKIPFFSVSLVFGVVAIYSQKSSIQEMAPKLSTLEHISVVCFSFVSYLMKAILPINLSVLYVYPSELGKTLPLYYYISILITLLIIIFVLYSLKRTKLLVFGFLFFLFTIILVLQIIPVGAATMADRYTYVPYIGLFFVLAKLIESLVIRLNVQKTQFLYGAILCVFIVFSALSFARVKIWENEGTLFTDVINQFPNSYISYQTRGSFYIQSALNANYKGSEENRKETLQKGIADYNMALQFTIKPDQKVGAYNNLGYAKFNLGDYSGAILAFSQAIQIDQKCISAYVNRGFSKVSLKNYQEAIDDFDKVLEIDPQNESALKNKEIAQSMLQNSSK